MREDLKRKSLAYRRGTEKFIPESSGEEGIRQIKALLGLGNLGYQRKPSQSGANARHAHIRCSRDQRVFCRDSVQPVMTEGMPNPLRNLTLQHVQNQEGILEADVGTGLRKGIPRISQRPADSKLSRMTLYLYSKK